MERVIPSFYCCYLLRSRRCRTQHYIGSTPSMPRRLRQHNGNIKGGAKRTAWTTRKPWEVACVVYGFPSNIAALQFEWAWDHPDTTRHIASDDRLTKSNTVERVSRRTGRVYRKRVKTTRVPFPEILGNLHQLLVSPTFNTWPLAVRFFAKDLHEKWRGIRQEATAALDTLFDDRLDVVEWPAIPKRLTKAKTEEQPADERARDEAILKEAEAFVPFAIRSLDARYFDVKDHVIKSFGLVEQIEIKCTICTEPLTPQDDATIICPNGDCKATMHILCTAQQILSDQQARNVLLPASGQCPSCRTNFDWAQAMKEVSLRTRGKAQVEKLFKTPRRRKGDIDIDDDSELSELDDVEMSALLDDEEASDEGVSDLEDLESPVVVKKTKTKPKATPKKTPKQTKTKTTTPKAKATKESEAKTVTPKAKQTKTPRKRKASPGNKENEAPAIADSDAGWSEVEILD